MLAIVCADNKSILGGRDDIYLWTKGKSSPFKQCGLNVLKTYDRIEVSASDEELKLLLECMPHLLPNISPVMAAQHSIVFFGEQALFIAFNFPYKEFENG